MRELSQELENKSNEEDLWLTIKELISDYGVLLLPALLFNWILCIFLPIKEIEKLSNSQNAEKGEHHVR